jgi:dolichol-phosphate mannosyltransferase
MGSSAHIKIIIPTYNERDNIRQIVEKVLSLGIPELSLTIVDDNSPDGTGAIADTLRNEHENISVIHRSEKQGLGPAYIAGFRHALAHGADLIFEMDADLSHDPEMIPAFIAASQEADLVLGSRYIPEGGIENWSGLRTFVSYFGNLYARLVLGSSVKDLTGGFKCYRRKVLESLDIDRLSSLGYVFQIETTYKAEKKGFRVKEIPIIFTERTEGTSKFNAAIFFGAFFKVLMLRFKK